jgi:hypothetical protein
VGVEVADAAEEDLARDAERGAHLDDLRDLLQLRGQPLSRGEDGLAAARRIGRRR